MPYLNGYDFVAALKTDKATADIPVVFLSVREDLEAQAARLGAAAYLRKPVRSDRLLEIVEMYAGC
jgi:CheY-like chemotaxis protein